MTQVDGNRVRGREGRLLNAFIRLSLAWLSIWLVTVSATAQGLPNGGSEPILLHEARSADEHSTIGDIAGQPPSTAWRAADTVATSYTKTVVWVRLPKLASDSVVEIRPIADKVTLFERETGSDRWRQMSAGDSIALSQRALPMAEVAFTLDRPIAVNSDRYLRISQSGFVRFQVTAWPAQSFAIDRARRHSLHLYFIGFCSAMILLNFSLALFVRDRVFAWNALTITSLLLITFYVSGYAGVWLWPEKPAMSDRLLILGIGSAIFCGSRFMHAYFRRSSADGRFLRYQSWFGVFMLALAAFGIWWPKGLLHAIMLLAAVAYIFALTCFSLWKAWHGSRRARLILVPMGLVVLPGLALTFMRSQSPLWARIANGHTLEATMALEALAFSLVLAARLRLHISEAAEAQRQLAVVRHSSAVRLAELQDEERRRLASDLHDSLGHDLAIAKAQLTAVLEPQVLSEEVQDRIGHASLSVSKAIAETRRISHALHPAALDHVDLANLIEAMCREMETAHAITGDLLVQARIDRLTKAEQGHLVRIVQEALANIARHSGATHFSIRLRECGDDFTLAIDDNGKGMPVGQAHGIGHTSMSYRASALGGKLTVSSPPGKGLRIDLSFTPGNQD